MPEPYILKVIKQRTLSLVCCSRVRRHDETEHQACMTSVWCDLLGTLLPTVRPLYKKNTRLGKIRQLISLTFILSESAMQPCLLYRALPVLLFEDQVCETVLQKDACSAALKSGQNNPVFGQLPSNWDSPFCKCV